MTDNYKISAAILTGATEMTVTGIDEQGTHFVDAEGNTYTLTGFRPIGIEVGDKITFDLPK